MLGLFVLLSSLHVRWALAADPPCKSPDPDTSTECRMAALRRAWRACYSRTPWFGMAPECGRCGRFAWPRTCRGIVQFSAPRSGSSRCPRCSVLLCAGSELVVRHGHVALFEGACWCPPLPALLLLVRPRDVWSCVCTASLSLRLRWLCFAGHCGVPGVPGEATALSQHPT
jgi:hypothetical protein